MDDKIIEYVNRHISSPLNSGEVKLVKRAFVPTKIRKRQYFLQEGEVCKYMAFIVKGVMRQFSVDNKGIEHSIELFIENWWASRLHPTCHQHL